MSVNKEFDWKRYKTSIQRECENGNESTVVNLYKYYCNVIGKKF